MIQKVFPKQIWKFTAKDPNDVRYYLIISATGEKVEAYNVTLKDMEQLQFIRNYSTGISIKLDGSYTYPYPHEPWSLIVDRCHICKK